MGKFCANCGKEVENGASFCGNCGNPLSEKNNNYTEKVHLDSNKNDPFCIMGFIFSFFIPILGIVFSIIGLSRIKTSGQKGRGLAIAGIVISIVDFIIKLITNFLIGVNL